MFVSDGVAIMGPTDCSKGMRIVNYFTAKVLANERQISSSPL